MAGGVRYSAEEDTWLSTEGMQYAAAEIAGHWPARFPRRATESLMKRRQQLAAGVATTPIASEGATARDRLGRIADLLERSGINPDDIGKVEKVRLNEWEGFYKDAEGEAHKVDMQAAAVILTPTWDDGPAWPVIQQAPPVEIHPRAAQPADARRDMLVAAILPDAQIGYYRDGRGVLHPTHDEAALDVAMQILVAANPDRVVFLGDNLDFPELGKYRLDPGLIQTTQPAVDRTTRYLGETRATIRKDAEIDWLEGNHELRLPNYLKDNAMAAFGLRRGEAPDSWPVLSVPYLCRFDEMGVTYHPGYPSSEIWLSDRLHCIHGYRAQKTSNAYPYLAEERASTIYAHTHRREWAERTRRTRHGPRTIMAASPGCLCRIDGAVPGTKSGSDLNGMPIKSWQDWQQGMAMVYYTPDDGPFVYEQIAIHHGVAVWHGQRFEATCDVEGKPLTEAAA